MDVNDFFTEELNKREKKEKKKNKKELKKKAKKEKELEKLEDIEFAKKLEEKKQEESNEDFLSNLKETKEEKSNVELTRELINFEKTEVKKNHSSLNFVLGFFLIILFLCSIDYLLFNVLKQNDIKLIITSSLLCVLSITYILSIIIKKEGLSKFFQILATISIACYMLYQLYII